MSQVASSNRRPSMRPAPFCTLVLCALLTVSAAVPAPLQAQRISIDSARVNDTSVVHAVVLVGGSRMVGRIVSVTADSLRIQSAVAVIAVARSAVLSVSQYRASALHGGELWVETPHASRMIFAPTAIPMRKGEAYFADFWIFLLSGAVGVTDKFTLGAGTTLFPGIDLNENVVFALPKYTVVDRAQLKVAVGGLFAYAGPADEGNRSLGVLYGVSTVGSRENNVTVGAGWGYVGGDLSSNPVLTVGGVRRVSKRVALISENWLLPFDGDADGILSYGFRFLTEKMAVDLAFAVPTSDVVFPGIPLLGFAIKY